jgi:hypothetical protein
MATFTVQKSPNLAVSEEIIIILSKLNDIGIELTSACNEVTLTMADMSKTSGAFKKDEIDLVDAALKAAQWRIVDAQKIVVGIMNLSE